MRKDVIVEVPKSARTPTRTIYGQIYTHSHDSKADRGKEHVFYSTGIEGVWGLADNKLSGIVDSMSDDDAGFPEGKAILEKHLYRERNSNLTKRAKKRFEKDHNNRVFCEACGFDFGEVYGDRMRTVLIRIEKCSVRFINFCYNQSRSKTLKRRGQHDESR